MEIAFTPPDSDAAVDWALAYAAAGMAVFPVKADKKPLTIHGFKDAAIDEDADPRLVDNATRTPTSAGRSRRRSSSSISTTRAAVTASRTSWRAKAPTPTT